VLRNTYYVHLKHLIDSKINYIRQFIVNSKFQSLFFGTLNSAKPLILLKNYYFCTYNVLRKPF